jgi:hypothetical protein
MFTFHHALFGQLLPQQFQATSAIWVFIYSVTIWTLWIVRNDVVFNHTVWPKAKVEVIIWWSLIDYEWATWFKLQQKN